LERIKNYKAAVAGPEETHENLSDGINSIADLLAPTLGPVGGHVVHERDGTRGPELLNDAATAVRRILSLGDPRVDVGAMLMRHIVWRVAGQVGDGGTATALLTREIYRQALKMLTAGIGYRELEIGLQAATAAVRQELSEMASPVETEDDLALVALTVVKDRSLAATIGELSYLLGPDARVSVEKFVAPFLAREYYSGANYKAEIASFHLYTDPIRKWAIYGDSSIALVDDTLSDAAETVALIEAAMKTGKKSLVIIASHFKEEALHVMVRNQTEEKKKISILGIQLKEIGDPRRMAFQDLTTLTGANILGRNYYAYAARAKEADLGEALRVQVDRKTMQLQPYQSRSAAVQDTVEQLRLRLEGLRMDDEERPEIINRLAALTGGMGVLKVGTNLKQEREILSNLSERALTATSQAHRTGVVSGGGAAFVHARRALDNLKLEGEEKFGVKVLYDALDAPFLQIVKNAGIESPSVAALHLEEAGPAYAYDVISKQLVNAHETGLVDVTGVQTAVLDTAVSGALMALGTNTIVFHRDPAQSMEP
jgi:chaperonin GroEL